jgi:hypothetical protein
MIVRFICYFILVAYNMGSRKVFEQCIVVLLQYSLHGEFSHDALNGNSVIANIPATLNNNQIYLSFPQLFSINL